MKKVKFSLNIGINGKQEDHFEYEDDTLDSEIEEDLKDWVNNYLDYHWIYTDDE